MAACKWKKENGRGIVFEGGEEESWVGLRRARRVRYQRSRNGGIT